MGAVSLPPGFRFHPTDEELVAYYLDRKISGGNIELEIIPEIDLYKCEPWDLPEKSYLPGKDMEWYFFSPRDRKYPNGSRTNRATRGGYWKATGKDRMVQSQKKEVGMKKTLVYYKGRAPHGIRTNWVMHEYRLLHSLSSSTPSPSLKDSYALCRVFKKTMHKDPRSKDEIEHIVVSTDTQLAVDNYDPNPEAGKLEGTYNGPNLFKHDGFCSKFPSAASSDLTNQDGTPTGSALSTDHDDIQPSLFATDEANSSAHFYPFASDYYSSNLIQDMQMPSSCFNYMSPLAIDDFPQVNLAETTMLKSSVDYHRHNNHHQDVMGCDKVKEYINGAVMFEDIFDLCSTQGNSTLLPLEDSSYL